MRFFLAFLYAPTVQRQSGSTKSECDRLDSVSKWRDFKSASTLRTRCFLFYFSCFSSLLAFVPNAKDLCDISGKKRFINRDKLKNVLHDKLVLRHFLLKWFKPISVMLFPQPISLSHFPQIACPWKRFPPKEEQLQRAKHRRCLQFTFSKQPILVFGSMELLLQHTVQERRCYL